MYRLLSLGAAISIALQTVPKVFRSGVVQSRRRRFRRLLLPAGLELFRLRY